MAGIGNGAVQTILDEVFRPQSSILAALQHSFLMCAYSFWGIWFTWHVNKIAMPL
jgi:hypothetical protein